MKINELTLENSSRIISTSTKINEKKKLAFRPKGIFERLKSFNPFDYSVIGDLDFEKARPFLGKMDDELF